MEIADEVLKQRIDLVVLQESGLLDMNKMWNDVKEMIIAAG